MSSAPRVGVLALQGGVAEHAAMLRELGAEAVLVKTAEQLSGLDAIVLPGGESSTMDRLLRLFGLRDPLREAVLGGLPTLGTCAGLILLSSGIEDPAPGQRTLEVLDVTVARNAFGSQTASEEAVLTWGDDGATVRAAFIRAPVVTRAGEGVTVLARHRGEVVAVASGSVVGISFHPELTGETAVHRHLLSLVAARQALPA
ncbi:MULTISPECIES: pyridoxal 5'-phosphate synthase glutaminase subunit PdxT [unclassified Kocuria]|uniref:pyridoxal 5'-phosphate synthase glutaminase subunit PdxT n=1 Tax=unclassified Kocuria TaxID=2649579 RepID=UPI00064AFA8A|nr:MULTISPECIES: pyridoxal 5'-phosphate synthase glutaminase subunit PdxT [unclassified Kocuria]KLU07997.1 glutamine amidotransferase [Kocuria sp. SM24M-10]OLT04773.1 glutamine amidotransferase subunit PdxT [Kocuria sp. CNJ-770]